jgi:UDP-2,3-diacylglucosamine pyrophosphatase LpxH
MARDDGRDVVVVSDLHLAAGYDERTGTYSRNEDFFYDGSFARFLAHLQASGRPWRLVLLGDVFDFLQVELGPPPTAEQELDVSEATTLAKFERIARGHPEFFAALGRFAAAGFPVDVVPGNHDVELVRPGTQRRFVELVVEASGRPEAAGAFSFHPWLIFIPGVLYAEHGHQYDDVNSFLTQLEPFVEGDPDRIDLPLGSYFVSHLFNRIEAIDPYADNVKPATAYPAWAMQMHPLRFLRTFGVHLRLLYAVLSHARDLGPEERRALRERYHATALVEHAGAVGLPHATLVEIDRLASVPAMSSQRRQLRAMVLRPLLVALPALAALFAIYSSLGRTFRSFFLFAAGLAGLYLRERGAVEVAYLQRAAERVDALLRREGRAVPAYVFGHSHVPEQHPLGREERPAYYLNSGSWTPSVPSAFDLLGGRECFSFVQVTRAPDGRVLPRLMRWNDTAGRPEVLPLLAP